MFLKESLNNEYKPQDKLRIGKALVTYVKNDLIAKTLQLH